MIFIHLSKYLRSQILIFAYCIDRVILILLFFFIHSLSFAQAKLNFYVSNKGNDSFPGTSNLFPKKTIAGAASALKNFSIANGISRLRLKEGDIFEENLITSYPIDINTYADNSTGNEFAILNGTKEFGTGWIQNTGSTYTFQQQIPYNGFVGYGINGIGQYSFIYVFEIDKELEKTAPFTARKLLKYEKNLEDVENNAGSFYTPVSNENPLPVYLHTSDGNSPNSSKKYRYEVTVRDWGVNSTYQPQNRFENLWVRGFGAGNGMLPGGANSYYNKIIFGPGAGIHHLVLRSGTINNSLFLPGAKNTNEFAVVFYDAEGLGRHCTIKNSIFLDIPTPVYAHTSFGSNYGAVEMDHVVGFADSLSYEPFMYTSNNDSVLLNNIYADGYRAGYFYGNAKYAAISNSCFKDITFGIAYNDAHNAINSKVENVFIRTKGTPISSGIIMGGLTTLSLNNSIIHLINTNNSTDYNSTGSFVSGTGGIRNKIVAFGNIFICDIDSSKSLIAATTNTNDGIATSKDSWDNNVYILLKGDNIQWSVSNPSTNGGTNTIRSFEDWKKQSGQDKHSLFFDLRNDSRGLKAIFEDPENGNYDLATTKEGNQVAALGAGMTDAISCFLKRPSYEQAAEIIRNDGSLSTNNCRNPCTQNSIKVNATFGVDSLNGRQVQLKWTITEQHNIDKYVVLRSVGNVAFTRISSIPVADDSIYTLNDNVQPGIEYKYRLMVVAKSGNQCYSDVGTITINDNKPFTIYPVPSTGKISIAMNGYIGKAGFKVINSNGQIVLEKESVNLTGLQSLDLTKQPKGFYWLQIAAAKGILVQKFILQ